MRLAKITKFCRSIHEYAHILVLAHILAHAHT